MPIDIDSMDPTNNKRANDIGMLKELDSVIIIAYDDSMLKNDITDIAFTDICSGNEKHHARL